MTLQTVICDECGKRAKLLSVVDVRGLREGIDGELDFTSIRVCRVCAAKAILVPGAPHPGAIVTDPSRWKWLWLRPVKEEG